MPVSWILFVTFVYPVTHDVEGQGKVTTYPLTPAYVTTICKCQGQTTRYLLVWLDSAYVPAGLAYVALSRVRRKQDISILQPMKSSQVTPVNTSTRHIREKKTNVRVK